jgi:hypothetical protein
MISPSFEGQWGESPHFSASINAACFFDAYRIWVRVKACGFYAFRYYVAKKAPQKSQIAFEAKQRFLLDRFCNSAYVWK